MKIEIAEKAKNLIKSVDMPKIGMGTFGSDKYDAETVSNAVRFALECGYRMFDCASVYGNEKEIGKVFADAFKDGIVERGDLFVASKVWNDMHGDGDVIKSCKQTLSDLGLEYLDLYFMHWPFPNYHAPHCGADARNPDSRPFFVDDFVAAWRQMEWLKKEGYVKNIAMSNMTIPKFEAVLPLCEIKPFAHETELHPSFQQDKLYEYCITHDMVVIGYCPLGSPNRPLRDKTPEDLSDTDLAEVKSVAANKSIHPVEVCLKWAQAKGIVPIPFSANRKNIESNFKAVNENPLQEKEIQLLASADKSCRLVKGHVFLWEGASDWHDLWDENGCLERWIKMEDGSWTKG